MLTMTKLANLDCLDTFPVKYFFFLLSPMQSSLENQIPSLLESSNGSGAISRIDVCNRELVREISQAY